MTEGKRRFVVSSRRRAAVAGLALFIAWGGAEGLAAQARPETGNAGKQMATTQSKFYCNVKALTPEERAHHRKLTEKLLAARKETVESAKGYEFQFSPKNVTFGELAEWVAMESKCCPFLDFHIDLENEGNLLCLRLTGEEGIKAFLRSEFQIPTQ